MSSLLAIHPAYAAAQLHGMIPIIAVALETNMPAAFYTALPDIRPAHFSTEFQKKPFRYAVVPHPPTIVRSDIQADIQRKADYLRSLVPHIACMILNPVVYWPDLYYFFDVEDIQVEGAAFLYYVINHIANENHAANDLRQAALSKQRAIDIKEWAREWMRFNGDRVRGFPVTVDLTEIFPELLNKAVEAVDQEEVNALKKELRYQHMELKKRIEQEATEASAAVARRQQQQPSLPAHLDAPRQFQQIQKQDYQHSQPDLDRQEIQNGQQAIPVISPKNKAVHMTSPEVPKVQNGQQAMISSQNKVLQMGSPNFTPIHLAQPYRNQGKSICVGS